MTYKNPAVAHQHTHDIEPVRLPASPVTLDPTLRGFHELPLLPTVHGFDRIAELVVGGPVEPWERLGLVFVDNIATVGSVRLRVLPFLSSGIQSVGLSAG